MKRRTKRIKNIHLFPGANEKEVRERTAYVRRRRSPAKRFFVRLLIVAGVLMLLVLLWNNWEKVAPESVLDWAQVQFGEAQAGNGYPIPFTGSSVTGMGQMGNYLAVLTDSSLQFFNASAGCMVQRPNTLNAPVLQTAGQYALVTELGGNRLRLETRRETVLELSLKNRKIYGSDVLPSGMVAVASDSASQSYVSQIQVYNKAGKLIYEYKTGKYLITSLSLMPGGKGLAAIGTAAEGGAMKCVLLIFDFSSPTPTEYSDTEQMLYNVTCLGDAVLALGDEEYWVLASSSLERHAHEGMQPIGYAASRKAAGLVMQRSGSTGSGEVWLLNSKGERIKTHPFAGSFRKADCRESDFLLLTDSDLFLITENEGNVQINTPSDTLLATQYKESILLLTLSDLQQMVY